MASRAYVHRRSADTNLAEIHEEMSELLIDSLNNEGTNSLVNK